MTSCSQTSIYSLLLLIDYSSVCYSLSRQLSLDNWRESRHYTFVNDDSICNKGNGVIKSDNFSGQLVRFSWLVWLVQEKDKYFVNMYVFTPMIALNPYIYYNKLVNQV